MEWNAYNIERKPAIRNKQGYLELMNELIDL